MSDSEAQIKALVEEWAAAVRAKDVDRMLRQYADDVLVYDLAAPLQTSGKAHLREHWAAWFASIEGPLGCEHDQLEITAGSEVAFCTALTHNTGRRKDGVKMDFWVRATVGFRKLSGEWKVTHEHVSVPFDMETTKACFDLRPQAKHYE